jgi:hypothetical protein
VYSISFKIILNLVHPIKGFIYESVRLSQREPNTLEALLLPQLHPRACCSGCSG